MTPDTALDMFMGFADDLRHSFNVRIPPDSLDHTIRPEGLRCCSALVW